MNHSILTLIVLMMMSSCISAQKRQEMSKDKLYAWCIVSYDKMERTPKERIEMLKGLGIKKYAYDWRKENLPEMGKELKLAKANGIEVISVWIWLDNNWDSIEKLNESNEKALKVFEEVGYEGQIWVSFHANFFEGLSDDEAVKKGAAMIEKLSQRAATFNCKVGLYNHGDWFGEPANQVKIIKALPNEDLGIVYNFHHAHQQLDYFPEMVETMMPYLWYVNLNGIRKGGPKILAVGEGDHEKEMIDLILEKGYKGDFGILGHVEDNDVEQQLKANISGLKKLYDF